MSCHVVSCSDRCGSSHFIPTTIMLMLLLLLMLMLMLLLMLVPMLMLTLVQPLTLSTRPLGPARPPQS